MSPAKDGLRAAANAFIRTSGTFDGVVDFDAAIHDPAHPADIDPRFDPATTSIPMTRATER